VANCLVLTKVDADPALSAEQSTAQGPCCAAHLHPSGVAAGHEPLIRVQPPGSFPQDGTCDLGERCTAGDRWRPLGTARLRWHVDQTWTRHARSRGQRRSASRTLPGKETPAGCPRQASPARAIALLGGALAGSRPGTSPCIGGLSAASGMVIPQRCTCSNRTEDGGWLADMAVQISS
jgi:hypothetical protein